MEVEGETFKKGNCSRVCGRAAIGRRAGGGKRLARHWLDADALQARSSRDANKQIFFKQKQFSYYSCWTTFLQFVFARLRFVLFIVYATIHSRLIPSDISNSSVHCCRSHECRMSSLKTRDCCERVHTVSQLAALAGSLAIVN